ncbi:hypothetical protein ACHAO1_004735 [Botrytis cinerea]
MSTCELIEAFVLLVNSEHQFAIHAKARYSELLEGPDADLQAVLQEYARGLCIMHTTCANWQTHHERMTATDKHLLQREQYMNRRENALCGREKSLRPEETGLQAKYEDLDMQKSFNRYFRS